MAFWNGVRQLKLRLNLYSNEVCRCYFPNQGFNVVNQHISSNAFVPVVDISNYVQNKGTLGFFSKVRFYAAPFKANKKKQENRASERKLNDQITTPFIRLVTDEGHSVVPLHEAMGRAKSLELDLVEVDSNAKPPVCKIMDYHKEKYLEQLKDKERAKDKTTLKSGAFKDVRFAANINQNDLKMKADNVKRLMESGFRVKCTATERKNEHSNYGDLEALLSRFLALIEDIAIVEGERRIEKKLAPEGGQNVEKKQAFIVVRHIKFGPAKGSGKKDRKDAKRVDSEDIVDEDVHQSNNSEWDVSNIDDDIENIFDEVNEPSKHEQPHTNPSGPEVSDSSKQMMNPRYQMENRYARVGARNNQTLDQAKSQQHDISAPIHGRPSQPGKAPPVHNASGVISNSPSKGYGIFSAQRPTSVSAEQKATTEFNRYKNKESSEPATSPGPTGFRSHSVSRVQRVDNPGQGKWGVFSADNSNMNENRAQNQRR